MVLMCGVFLFAKLPAVINYVKKQVPARLV